MIIVSGWLRVEPDQRDDYLASCVPVVQEARALSECLDFHIDPDLLEPARINVFEMWESVEAVEAFRGRGSTAEQQHAIIDAHIEQHMVASTTRLT